MSSCLNQRISTKYLCKHMGTDMFMWLMDGSWYKVVVIEENQPNHPVEF